MTDPRTPEELFEIALEHMPDIEPEIVPGTWRWNVVDGLTGSDNLGIELGVAGAAFRGGWWTVVGFAGSGAWTPIATTMT